MQATAFHGFNTAFYVFTKLQVVKFINYEFRFCFTPVSVKKCLSFYHRNIGWMMGFGFPAKAGIFHENEHSLFLSAIEVQSYRGTRLPQFPTRLGLYGVVECIYIHPSFCGRK
jgi:hypothetical protein